ncbi:MAG: ABC transporter ATP-binding protein [Phycisphaerales bacterium]
MALEAHKVGVVYPGGRRAIDGVSAVLNPGQITVVVGPNGSGKSTLLRALAGVRSPENGTITLDGAPISGVPHKERARRLALVAQHPSVAFGYPVSRVIAFGAEGSGAGQTAVDRAIERFMLGDVLDAPFDELSVGQRQRVSLARAWAQIDAQAESYFLADEPISAMDPKHAAATLAALSELAERGVGVVVVLHDLSAAARIGDQCVLLNTGGRLSGAGSAEDLLTPDVLSELYDTPILRANPVEIGPVLGSPMPSRIQAKPRVE